LAGGILRRCAAGPAVDGGKELRRMPNLDRNSFGIVQRAYERHEP
jgi:hypothetical protein